jgi:hypothetical protein
MTDDNWFRNSIAALILIVMTAALVVGILGLSKSASQEGQLKTQQGQLVAQQGQLKQQEQALKANVLDQVTNRARNVYTWCGAIDAERTILVTYIAHVSGQYKNVPVLDLPQLDCKAIADRTLASARHK